MKKTLMYWISHFFILIVLFTTFFTSFANAESFDFSSLPFNELLELKKQVDEEFFLRKESGPRTLFPGKYIIGEDIPAGSYYYCVLEPTDSVSYVKMELYPDRDSYLNRDKTEALEGNIYCARGPYTQIFKEGNYLSLRGANLTISMKPIPDSLFYKYDPPEGTLVREGKYFVGKDIPQGEYYVYPSTASSATVFCIFENEDRSTSQYFAEKTFIVSVTKSECGTRIKLNEGQVITVSDGDVIMKKEKEYVLVFD